MIFGIRWGSLRTKIIAWSFFPTAIILVAVALVTFYAYQEVTEELVIERDQDLTRLSAGQLATELTEYTDLLAAIARTADIFHSNPAAQQVALRQASNRLAVFDGGVLILNPFGTVVAAEPERPEVLGQDWSNRSYSRQMVRSPKPTFSDIVTDGPQGTEGITVAVPLSGDQGEFLGTIVGMFRLDTTAASAFYGSIVKLRFEESGSTYLVDGNGRVIYHSDADHIGEDFSTQAVVQQVLSGQVGAIRTRDSDGQDIVAGFAPVPGTAWGLITEESWATLTSASRGYQQFLLLLLVLGVVVPALVVAVGVRRIMQPIEGLIGAAQEVARGNFGQTITARTGDEIEELARQFNLMSAQLQESYAHLEQRVADRTRELSALYDVTAVASASLDLETVLESSLERVLAVMGSEVGAIHLLDETKGMLHLAAGRGIPPGLVAKIDSVPVDSGLAGWVIEHGEPLVVSDIATGPRPLLAIPARGSQAYVGAPMRARGQVLGVLSVVGERGRQFKVEEVALLASIADEVGVAVENARLYQQAEQVAAMKERQRLAQELHDSVTQSLYSLTLFAEAGRDLARAGELERVEGYLTRLGEIAQHALKEMRLLVYQLRPLALQKEGLVGALQQRLDAVERRAGVEARLLVEELVELPAPVEEGLYRIAQEALNNALKHAAATSVTVYIRAEDERVELEVVDDGLGFDPDTVGDRGGMGLTSIRERAEKLGGSLTVLSAPGEGTRVKVSVEVRTPTRSYDFLEVSR